MDRLKFKNNVDLSKFLLGFIEDKNTFNLNSSFDEFIYVDKYTREISQYGYNGLVCDWIIQGLLERV